MMLTSSPFKAFLAIFSLFCFLTAIRCGCDLNCCSNIEAIRRPPITWTYYQDTARFVGGYGQYSINTIG